MRTSTRFVAPVMITLFTGAAWVQDFIDSAAAQSLERIQPDEVERVIYQRIAEQAGLELASLTSVDCGPSRCAVVLSPPENDSQDSDGLHKLHRALTDPPWNSYRVTQGSFGRRELAPGVEEYVLRFTYIPFVDVSDDPRIAARQHAACAGAWQRVTKLRGSNEYMRLAHEKAAEHLQIAARTLGLEEARRAAGENQLGPLTRDCHAMPY